HREVRLACARRPVEQDAAPLRVAVSQVVGPRPCSRETVPCSRPWLEAREGRLAVFLRHPSLRPEHVRPARLLPRAVYLAAEGAEPVGGEREPVQADRLGLERAPARLAPHLHQRVTSITGSSCSRTSRTGGGTRA